jgi:hypothetical protein
VKQEKAANEAKPLYKENLAWSNPPREEAIPFPSPGALGAFFLEGEGPKALRNQDPVKQVAST